MKIRPFKVSDVDQIAQLFHDTVRNVNIIDYSEQQVKAWAPDNIYFRDWEEECSRKFTFVAEEQEMILGFAELDESGYIDCFYCHSDFQGRGIGKSLFQALEKKAIELNLDKMYAEVSVTAKSFFTKMGFSVQREQKKTTRGESFKNYKMQKKL